MSASGLASLPPLREIIAHHKLGALKSLGQNFLLDLNLTAKIARCAAPLNDLTVLEVGPGPGGLTRALLDEGARHVIAIDMDRRLPPVMDEIATHAPGRLTFMEGDALTYDLPTDRGEMAIVANLPYNIATPLLVRWLTVEPWPPVFSRMVLMFQREVADRITAQPGTKAYGRLSVLTQWRTVPDRMFDIPPSAFTPPPKVTSTVVRFDPIVAPLACDRASLERVTAVAFNRRRKMLRAALTPLGLPVEPLLAAAELDPTARAEPIPVEGFVNLANAYDRMRREA
ncbi:MAG: 16S rRNA (adenine(1518)-N(6)/adenine(1519)-N(6))-dimethyltransferase RsmA [Pseudomonadota bacterium]